MENKTTKKKVKKKAVKNDNSAKLKQMERDLERSYFRNSELYEEIEDYKKVIALLTKRFYLEDEIY